MCGITGIFAYSNAAPPVNSQELLQIREVMTARGPDDAGIWLSERIGLAHRRLSIIDLTKMGTQPMTTQDGIFRIVFNGEIYNYRQLRSQLKAKGYSFHTNSDTEVLLHLYAEYGAKMVYHIRGMYAFAIWDDKNKGLFLARDPFGIKPLYYADDGLSFRFASQVKALLKGGQIDITPQAAGHVGFYLWGYVPEPYTLRHLLTTSRYKPVDRHNKQSSIQYIF
jgi:asparagine synthase (glutamine-hydrolysing)